MAAAFLIWVKLYDALFQDGFCDLEGRRWARDAHEWGFRDSVYRWKLGRCHIRDHSSIEEDRLKRFGVTSLDTWVFYQYIFFHCFSDAYMWWNWLHKVSVLKTMQWHCGYTLKWIHIMIVGEQLLQLTYLHYDCWYVQFIPESSSPTYILCHFCILLYFLLLFSLWLFDHLYRSLSLPECLCKFIFIGKSFKTFFSQWHFI